MTDLQSLSAKIAKLRMRTIDRGASEAEQEQAALKIGQLIMGNPGLQIVANGQPKARVESRRKKSTDWVVFESCYLIRKTDKALLLVIEGEQVWVPKLVVNFGESYLPGGNVVIKRWFVEKELGHVFEGAA